MNEMVYIGKTVSTFGIKGELKVISDFECCNKAYKLGNKVLINNIEHTITGVRSHKNYILLEIDNLKNINDILKYVGFNIYIKRMDLHLDADEFLYKDLIGATIMDEGANLGKVIDISYNVNLLIKVKGEKEFYIPFVDEYIEKFDLSKKILYTKNVKNLIF